MKLYSYVVVSDTGFAPNPFDNFCSLACCKPKIRKSADIGDWVIGTGSKSTVGNEKLIYAMEITEKMNFDEYFKDNRFNERLDNIYYLENDSWKQKENSFHYEKDIEHDLSGLNVLISNNYYYFGKKAVKIPLKLNELIKKGPGHKSNFNDNLIIKFIEWIEKSFDTGITDYPYHFKVSDRKCKFER